MAGGVEVIVENEWKVLTCILNTQTHSTCVFLWDLNQQHRVLSSQNMTSAHVFSGSPYIKLTSSQQGHCKCSLLSDQTKQARLHKHSCLAIKAQSGACALLPAQPPHHSTLLSSSFEVVPRSSPPLASLPSAVPELLHYQPTAAAIIRKGTAG